MDGFMAQVATCRRLGPRDVRPLLALPLIVLLVHLTFPEANKAVALFSPLPLAFYVVLLAGTDLGWQWAKRRFTRALLSGIGVMCAIGGVTPVSSTVSE